MASKPAAEMDRIRGAGAVAEAGARRSVAQSPGADGVCARRVDRRTGREGDGVLLTGATGFIGMELLARFLERTDRRVYALVRAASDEEAESRLAGVLRCLFGADRRHAKRVVAVRGDITRPGLGLGRDLDALASAIGEIVHGAASVSFDLSPQVARAINVEGTRRVLELAQRCDALGGLRRLTYVSTAYVAGDHDGCFSEDELRVGQGFRNTYEHSKFEAEGLVGAWRRRLPITVVRPSIVVGERSSGWTTSFNVLYWPLRAFAHGAYAAVPARRDARADVVPVDYVADAIFELGQARETEGATLHVTAGEHAISVGRLVEMASRFFRRPAPRLIEPSLYRAAIHPLLMRLSRNERQRRTLKRSEVFFPYFATKVAYDNRRCRAALCGSGIAPPPLDSYFDRLAEFALAAGWGHSPISRADASRRTGGPGSPPATIESSRRAAPASRSRLVPVG